MHDYHANLCMISKSCKASDHICMISDFAPKNHAKHLTVCPWHYFGTSQGGINSFILAKFAAGMARAQTRGGANKEGGQQHMTPWK